MLFFYTYVRPTLEYASIVWSLARIEDINRIESVQRYFTKKIALCEHRCYKDRLIFLRINSLQYRRGITDLLFIFNLFANRLSCNILPYIELKEPSSRPTRGHNYQLVKP